jgi:hypothetical protein
MVPVGGIVNLHHSTESGKAFFGPQVKNAYFVLVAVALIAVLLRLIRSNQVRRIQARRDPVYQPELQRFQPQLRWATPRSGVTTYLHSHPIAYRGINQNLDVKIGEDPGDSIFRQRWNVYVEMSFAPLQGQIDPSPLDNLDGISIGRIGTCV